jgi:hypothetical protein
MRTLLCAALLALTAAAPVHAGNLLDLAVVDRDTGATLNTYSRNGKLYVAGTPGHRYAVRLSNRSGARVLAVLSVDGVNAVSGETAGTDQNGYVLDAWESTEINGWRKNLDEIAQFNFTALPDSYAARTGRPVNVGVIGIAVFAERRPVWREQDKIGRAMPLPAPQSSIGERESAQAGSSDTMPADAAATAKSQTMESASPLARREAARERLGTGHGEREWSRVATTRFDRASSQPSEQLAIWYDSYPNLAARGIVPSRPVASREPDPFPNRFVPDLPRR